MTMGKQTIYLIPGVGADETVFSRLTFPKQFEVKYLEWLPLNQHEKLDGYVERLSKKISPDTQPIYLGLSFGGIVASELSKLIPAKKVILISSIKTHYERPLRMSLLELFPLHRFLPGKMALDSKLWHDWAFGKTTAEEQVLIDNMIKNVDLAFNEWAVHQAINWENKAPVDNILHIHGDRDKIFPTSFMRDYTCVPGGTHFMIVSKANEVSEIIARELANLGGVKNSKSKTIRKLDEKNKAA